MPYLGGEETVREIRRALANPNVQSDPLRYRNTILRVIRLMSQGVDVSGVFTEMVKACASVDVVQKKLVYVFLVSYASTTPDLSLLVINTLRKDCQDPNPMVRSLALRNMTNLRLPGLLEYVEQPLCAGLRDRAACVRRVAVLGWAKIHNLQPDTGIDASIVNELYGLLRDSDPVVMVNCLRALEEILRDEGGVAINKPIAHHLLNRLQQCDVWGQCEVLRVLQRYQPSSEEELFDILSVLDPSLLSPHPPLAAATLALFLGLCSSLPAAGVSALERAQGPLLATCGSSCREMRFSALCHIQLLMRSAPGLMGAHFKRFFCSYAEPAYIKQRKMQVLVELVNDENVSLVLDELKGHCTDVNPDTAHAAITAIGRIGRSYSDRCLDILTDLLRLKQEHITSAVVQTLGELVWACPQSSSAVCSALEGWEDTLLDTQGRQALLWLLGVYGEHVSGAPYLLEAQIDGLRSEVCVEVKMELLTSTLRMFLCRPAETQDMLGRLLHYCMEEETDMCVRDQAALYYRLLHCGIDETRRVLQGRRSDPSLGVLIGRPSEPVSQWAGSFNTLAPLCLRAAVPEPANGGSPEQSPPTPNLDLRTLTPCPVPPPAEDMAQSHHDDDDGDVADGEVADVADGDGGAASLSLSPSLSPEQFEQRWLQEEVCVEVCVSCPAARAPPSSLQAALQLVNIHTLAFTPPHTQPWRVYLYTHTSHTHLEHTPHTLILGELLCTGEREERGGEREERGGEREERGGEREEEGVREREEEEGRSREREEGLRGEKEEGVRREEREVRRGEREEEGVRVIVKQQPKHEEALKVFLSVLTTVLHTVSMETT